MGNNTLDKDAEINRLKLLVAQQNEHLEDFAYVVSHDLRAPMRGILSLAGWLKDDYAALLDEQGIGYLEKLMGRTRRMNGMLESILRFSRIGRSIPHYVTFASAPVVEEVIQSLSIPPHITVTLQGELPSICFDQGHFITILEHLIGNAVQHLGKPSGTITISCRSLAEEQNWEFRVADDGVGIEEKHKDLIFKMFRTLAPAGETEVKGVGLALVKRILFRSGGDIRVESQKERGSRFCFTIPQHPVVPIKKP